MTKEVPAVSDHSAEFCATWGEGPLQAWPPAELKETSIAHPEIPPSPEEATEGQDTIEQRGAERSTI